MRPQSAQDSGHWCLSRGQLIDGDPLFGELTLSNRARHLLCGSAGLAPDLPPIDFRRRRTAQALMRPALVVVLLEVGQHLPQMSQASDEHDPREPFVLENPDQPFGQLVGWISKA